jgi:hypothetical protein
MRVDAYFDKPLDHTLLLAKIAELLASDRDATAAGLGNRGTSPTEEAH